MLQTAKNQSLKKKKNFKGKRKIKRRDILHTQK